MSTFITKYKYNRCKFELSFPQAMLPFPKCYKSPYLEDKEMNTYILAIHLIFLIEHFEHALLLQSLISIIRLLKSINKRLK